MASTERRNYSFIAAIVAVFLLTELANCQENQKDEAIQAERVKRDVTNDGDVTTVLLVDNLKLNKDINSRNGRYLNVKPVIGLLTSTARTFIQDGVTTEYATEVVGTTLDNGRVYAQLLTKSSLVLYDKPSDFVQESTKRTRLPYEVEAKKWNVEDNLGDRVKDQYIIKNTDYVSPKEGADLFTVFTSKPSKEYLATAWNPTPTQDAEIQAEKDTVKDDPETRTEKSKVLSYKEIPRYSEFEAFNFLDPLPAARERKISSYGNINIEYNKEDKTTKSGRIIENLKEIDKNISNKSKNIEPAKVNPNIKLPTFTVKNEFSPIFYYIDNVESKTEKSYAVPNYFKNAKKLFGSKDDYKPMKTFTYYGFANFTTTVGETIIVFSPSTANEFVKESQDEITPSVLPEIQPNIATRLKTFLSSDLSMVTKTMFGHQLNMQTALPTLVMKPQDSIRSSKALSNQMASLKNVLFEKPIQEEEQAILDDKEKFNRVIASLKSGLFIRPVTQFSPHRDVIQPSETSYSTILRTQPTDKLQESEETIREEKISQIQATEPLGPLRPTAVIDAVEEKDETSITSEKTQTELRVNINEEEEQPTTENYAETLETTEDTLSTPQMDETSEENNTDVDVKEDDNNSEDSTCTGEIIPVPTMTTAYKTFTYLTTYFIPLEGTETTTSIKSHEVVSTETGFITNLHCKSDDITEIIPTATMKLEIESTSISLNDLKTEKPEKMKDDDITEPPLPVLTTTEKIVDEPTTTTTERKVTESIEETTTDRGTTNQMQETTENSIKEDSKTTIDFPVTTENIISTSESHIEVSVTTESDVENRFNLETTTELKEADEPKSEENEIDLIFKTLYTTYTYFTTYFQGSTSTISSKKSIVTNVITSTLDLSNIDPSIFNAIESSDYLFKATQKENLGKIIPTSVGAGRPTQTFAINSILDLVQHKQVIDSAENEAILSSRIQTPELGEENLFEDIKADVVKTFYTTYTFFTTLYVDTDINICSRSEVYTNYVGPASLIPTKTSSVGPLKTQLNAIDFNNCKKVKPETIASTKKDVDLKKSETTTETMTSKQKQVQYTSIDRTNKNNAKKTETAEEVTENNQMKDIILEKGESMLVTDVKSSYSKGDRQIIDNAILDDQISSESNIDEIMPSPTLLLQTSYTTFTYFTTMYLGKDSSKVKSRLETLTNVVTETLDPKTTEVEETNLPITYYTTFTYWTTLYKDKTTTITSREDIISNVVTPSLSPSTVSPIDTHPIEVATVQVPEIKNNDQEKDIKPSTIADDLLADDGKATFFTTYTYFTTYYIGNSSELRSSLETITNIVDNTKDLVNENAIARAVGKEPAAGNLFENGEKPIIKSTALPDLIIPTKVVGDNAIIPTHIIGSSENIIQGKDEKQEQKKILFSQVAIISGDSTVITNANNKPEQSKENSISSTKVIDSSVEQTKITTPSVAVIEGSVTEPTTEQTEDGENGDDEEEDEETEDENGNITRKKSRLTFSTRKRTFTPVIRPFASRNRPTFSPKRVSITSSATTITRSDFTPTITATPALKSAKSTGFGNRKTSSSAYPGGATGGGRRFSRISSSATVNSPSPRSTGFGRGRSSVSEIQPTNTRRGGFRTGANRPSVSEYVSRSSVSRIRPTRSSVYRGNKQTTTPSSNSDDASTFVTENPTALTNEAETITQSTDSEAGLRRTTNALLRFRRPPFTRAPLATTPRTATQATTQNRNRGPPSRNRAGTTTTARPTTRTTTLNPLFALRNRQRPNSLFPPRGLINKQPEPQPEEETVANQNPENEEDLEETEENEFNDDTEYDSSNQQESQVSGTTEAPKRINNIPSIKPFGFRRRSKRQASDYGSRRNYSNFRRPTSRVPKAEPKIDIIPEEVVTPASRIKSRYSSRNNYHSNNNNNTPKPTTRSPRTSPPSTSRQPFILRGESKTSPTQRSSFRSRSSRTTSRSSAPTANLRPKAPRLKTYQNTQTEPTRTNRPSGRSRSRSRTTSRYRTTTNDIIDSNYINYQIQNDGKLTVTHKIPIEVTIPVVNGKLTEYKNVLTAKPSTEILQPNQYSTTQNAFGSQYIILVSESSEPAENGATKVIQFILHETPTTSIIFTPTTIRGRRTSFSHVIPSTVYDVERVTSTVQPQINPNVPLANILLSQLLLGNIGMPQPPINPLLALQGQNLVPGTPTTEFKIRTTTYVTTVTDAKSTVLPITFRGKEILTTIVDSSVDVITATEFITDTVVVTPTVAAPNQNQNQLNSILLLLQQQQIQQQQVTANPLSGLSPDINLLQNSLPISNNDLYNNPKPEVLDPNNSDDYLVDIVDDVIITKAPPAKKAERRKPVVNKPIPPRESSVITLYVSGRHPGEFSTVLSTVFVDGTQSVQKREAIYFEEFDVSPSDSPTLNQILGSQSDLILDTFLMPALDNSLLQDTTTQRETQSLESIIGEITKYIQMDNPSSTVETTSADSTIAYVIKESDTDLDR